MGIKIVVIDDPHIKLVSDMKLVFSEYEYMKNEKDLDTPMIIIDKRRDY